MVGGGGQQRRELEVVNGLTLLPSLCSASGGGESYHPMSAHGLQSSSSQIPEQINTDTEVQYTHSSTYPSP